MKNSDLVHLHVHTPSSHLDGLCKIDDLIDRVKELGQEAVAITDHGALYGIVPFYKKCKKAGIKPIIGSEVYTTEDRSIQKKSELEEQGYGMYHLVLLAKNDTGYKNLLKIVTDANENGFYRKPRTDDNFLESHAEGIVALSACMQGRIPQLILDDKYEEAKEQALKYNDFFDEFYLEVQPHSITGQQHLNQTLQRMSEETGIPLVATADAHYVKKEDAYNQEVLMAISMHNSMNDKDRFRLSEENFWIKSIEEFKEYDIPDEAIKNTKKIADQCNLELELEGNKYPEYPDINPGETEEDFLRRLVDQKFIEFVINDRIPDPEKYYKRLQYELDIITDKGYPGYFLIVRDFIIYGEEQGILMGPGRGSAAGSLVSYLIGITKIDPIKYGLIFERFLNPERESPPDYLLGKYLLAS